MLEESKQIEHASTKGVLRERYLTDFLRSLLPPNLVVAGGFICDVLGNITPQIDLIVSDTSTIPSVAFTGDEDAKVKRSTIETYWVPGVNNLGAYGRWAFAEFTEVYQIEADFEARVEDEFDRMIDGALLTPSDIIVNEIN